MSIVQSNKEAVLEQLRRGRIEGARIGERNFVETIVKKMLGMGILDELRHVVKDFWHLEDFKSTYETGFRH